MKCDLVVVGAGNMGSGIAQKYAMHGHQVAVVDQSDISLKKSQASINDMLKQGVKRGIFNEEQAESIIGRILFTTDLAICKNKDLVIEAIFEDLDLKQQLFLELDRICKKSTILATNTSSLKVSDLQKGLTHPERVLGLHYFYPPAKNRLVEIIGTETTDANALKYARAWQESINKTVIESKDSPGFIVNRFFVPWLNEAIYILNEGIANSKTIEEAAKQFFNISMGPFELMNVTGLPITMHSCTALAKSLGSFYAPAPMLATQIESKKAWDISGTLQSEQTFSIGMRLLAVVSSISCQMVFEEQVCSKNDANLGAQVGLLWPKGPFELQNDHLPYLATALLNEKKIRKDFVIAPYLKQQLSLT